MKPEKLPELNRWGRFASEPWITQGPLADADRQPCRVFVNSMSDLFHPEVSDEFVREVLNACRSNPGVVYQVLTKRPARAAAFATTHPDTWWPTNVWLGVSVEDHRVVDRIDTLRKVPARTRFVSFEPLIGPVGDTAADLDLADIDWAIVGGESGPTDDRREMDHAWARMIRDACAAQSVAFFFKQSSGRHHGEGRWLQEPDFRGGRLHEEFPPIAEATARACRSNIEHAGTGAV
jgi:protein gp37